MLKVTLLLGILSAFYMQEYLVAALNGEASTSPNNKDRPVGPGLESIRFLLDAVQRSLLLAKTACNASEESLEKHFQGFEKIGSRYFFIEHDHEVNWWAASNICRQKGGFLATPRNLEELNQIIAKLVNKQRYWVGINNLGEDDKYVSQATGLPAYLKWGTGQPSRVYGNAAEHCVELKSEDGFYMNDKLCENKTKYICELDY
ncbi:C-type lectin 37Db-like [Drosophila eugracilis]|uniref:C-type lectin 37Db-like n=1 Tax=Drosophila eugracilis TaxID=29029 RepID=UPI001BDB15BC|nr:C-type lectin 37Db-like [Drosophila eugracilis]